MTESSEVAWDHEMDRLAHLQAAWWRTLGLALGAILAAATGMLIYASPDRDTAGWLAVVGIVLIGIIAGLGFAVALKVYRHQLPAKAFALPQVMLLIAGTALDFSAFFSHHRGYMFCLGVVWFGGIASNLWTLAAVAWPGRRGPTWRQVAAGIFGVAGSLALGRSLSMLGERLWGG